MQLASLNRKKDKQLSLDWNICFALMSGDKLIIKIYLFHLSVIGLIFNFIINVIINVTI